MGQNQRLAIRDFANEYVNALKQNAPTKTGALKQSITAKVHDDSIDFDMYGYALILDEGINGTEKNQGSKLSFTNKKPPISALQGYADSIGANVYALQRSIFKHGFKGKKFITEDYKDHMQDFAEQITQAVADDFLDEGRKILGDN